MSERSESLQRAGTCLVGVDQGAPKTPADGGRERLGAPGRRAGEQSSAPEA